MGIVCFRYQPDGAEREAGDALNETIVDAVNAAGRTYLTRTRLKGRVVMRIGIGNVLTTEDHIAHAWQEIRSQSQRVGAGTNEESSLGLPVSAP